MEVLPSDLVDEILPEGVQRVEVSVLIFGNKPFLRHSPDFLGVITKYDLERKLLSNSDGNDLHLFGLAKGGEFKATYILEGHPWDLKTMSPQDFVLFREALDIPYVDSEKELTTN